MVIMVSMEMSETHCGHTGGGGSLQAVAITGCSLGSALTKCLSFITGQYICTELRSDNK